jgi:hypothetical protein
MVTLAILARMTSKNSQPDLLNLSTKSGEDQEADNLTLNAANILYLDC